MLDRQFNRGLQPKFCFAFRGPDMNMDPRLLSRKKEEAVIFVMEDSRAHFLRVFRDFLVL